MPFAPVNLDIGQNAIGNGLASFGQSIGAAINRHAEEQKKREDELKFANGMRSLFANDTMASKLGLTKDEIKAMGAHEFLGMVQGLSAVHTVKGLQAQDIANRRQEFAADNDATDAHLNQGLKQAEIDATMGNQERARAEAARQARIDEQRQGFLSMLTSGDSGMSEQERFQQALQAYPGAALGKDGDEWVKGMAVLKHPGWEIKNYGGADYLVGPNPNVSPLRISPQAKPTTKLQESTTRLNNAKANKLEEDAKIGATNIDHNALMQAVAGFAKNGHKEVRLVKTNGKITGVETPSWWGPSNTSVNDALTLINQQAGSNPAAAGTARAATPQASDMVPMISPDGKRGKVPRDKVEAAKKADYKEQ